MSGFRRQKNLGEIIAPSKPRRQRRQEVQTGCYPCQSPRSCTLHQSGALQVVTRVWSRHFQTWHNLPKRLQCNSPNLVYQISCMCGDQMDYIGSTKDLKGRWTKHKKDIREHRWPACGLTRHMGQFHLNDLEAASSRLQVTILDQLEGDFSDRGLKTLEDRWIVKMGTCFANSQFNRGNTRNEVLSHQRRNWGGAH